MQKKEKTEISYPFVSDAKVNAHGISYLRLNMAQGKGLAILVITIMILFVGALSAQAANYYVRKGATGSNNGTNWTNAWNEMNQINWASIKAGDTIWLAGGNYYSSLAPQKSGTSSNRIYIKRVRSTDSIPVSAAGWNSSFDSQVIINTDTGIMFPNEGNGLGSYITIDGQVDSGIKSKSPGSGWWGTSAVWINNDCTGVVLQYIDMAGPAGSDWYTHAEDCSGIQIRSAYGTPSNLTVRNCRMHGAVNGVVIVALNGGVFEYNKIYDTLVANYQQFHNNSVAIRNCWGTITWRYNEFWNGGAEGIMLGATADDTACRNEIYGNVMHSPPPGGASWRFVEAQYKAWQVIAYNNTLVDLPMGFRTVNNGTFASGSAIRNNLFVNVSSPINVSGSYTSSNNITNGSTSLFINYQNDNYRLASSTSPGYTLSSPYNTDMDGKIRGADGTWDIGAYEYGGSVPPPTTDLNPPARFRIVSE